MSRNTEKVIDRFVDTLDQSITSSDGYGGLSAHGRMELKQLLGGLIEIVRSEIIAEMPTP